MKRAQQETVIRDLSKKMVFLAGPRQAGKTTLAKTIASQFSSVVYLNYDSMKDRKILLEKGWLPSTSLLIFDEIHKMPEWKNYLKGIYDTKPTEQKILATGSARLEIFTEAGDSLAGRYFLHRLMPFSPAECRSVGISYSLGHLLERGGFPEPFLTEDSKDADRWRLQYVDSLLREDVLDFENIQGVKAIRLLFELLRQRVGSPISYTSLAEDIGISPNTVKKYIQILEALYIVFRVTPFSRNIARSLLKEPKIYFFDAGLINGDLGAKLENFVAGCLLKHVFAKADYEGKRCSLHYLQTKEKKEVDFALTEEEKITQIFEVKTSDTSLSSSLHYFHGKYGYPATQLVVEPKREYQTKGIEIRDVLSFLKTLKH